MVIDVSNFQGKIDWTKVKAAGIEGAIIRCGWGQDMESQDDPAFHRNVEECIRLGIPFGAYFYSYAKNTMAAEGEARHCIRLLGPYKDKMTFPVFYDCEQSGTEGIVSQTAKVFVDAMRAAGYHVGIYSTPNWFKNYIRPAADVPKWVAYWSSHKPNVNGMVAWQYTSKGRVPGITENTVDCNEDFGLAFAGAGTVPTPAPAPAKKSNEEMAAEVWAGKWGTMQDKPSRKQRLEAAGYNFAAIQALVNKGIGKPAEEKTKQDAAQYYVIQWGDTLSGIAKKFKTQQKQLIEWNNIKDKNKIKAGDKIRVK